MTLPDIDIDEEIRLFGNAAGLLPGPSPLPPVVVRSSRSPTAPAVGRHLIRKGGPPVHTLFEQVLVAEVVFVPRGGHDVALLLAAKTFETALYLTLAQTLKDRVPRVVGALRDRVKAETYKFTGPNLKALDAWGSGKVTMFTLAQIIDMLRRHAAAVPGVPEALAATFHREFLDLLRDQNLVQHMFDMTELRNSVAHANPEKMPTVADYEGFKDRVVARGAFKDWHAAGPDPHPPGNDRGLLHHLLAGLKVTYAPPATARDAVFDELEFLADAVPATDPTELGVTADVTVDDWLVTRAVGAGSAAAGRFQVGEYLRYAVTTTRPTWVRVLDFDKDVPPDGAFALLWPNPWEPDRQVDGAGLEFPAAPGYPRPGEYRLSGTPGDKYLLVLAGDDLPRRNLKADGSRLRTVPAADVLECLSDAKVTASVRRYHVG